MAHIGGGSLPLLVTVGRGEQRWREIEPSLVGCGGGGHRHLAGVPNLYQVLSHSFVIKFIQYPITSFGYKKFDEKCSSPAAAMRAGG